MRVAAPARPQQQRVQHRQWRPHIQAQPDWSGSACSACSTLEIRHQHGGDDAGADDDDTDGRGSVRYTYALQHQQGGGSSASSDGSSGHVLFQAGSTGIAFGSEPAELHARPTLVLPRRPAPRQRHVCRRLRH